MFGFQSGIGAGAAPPPPPRSNTLDGRAVRSDYLEHGSASSSYEAPVTTVPALPTSSRPKLPRRASNAAVDLRADAEGPKGVAALLEAQRDARRLEVNTRPGLLPEPLHSKPATPSCKWPRMLCPRCNVHSQSFQAAVFPAVILPLSYFAPMWNIRLRRPRSGDYRTMSTKVLRGKERSRAN